MTEKLKSELAMIREEDSVNMFDFNGVQRAAYEHDFYDLVVYLEDNRKDYLRVLKESV